MYAGGADGGDGMAFVENFVAGEHVHEFETEVGVGVGQGREVVCGDDGAHTG